MRKLVEVEPLFQEALQASRKVLGDEHADTLTPISNNIVGTLHIEIIVGGHAPHVVPPLHQASPVQFSSTP